MDMEKDEACKMERQNKKCNCARKSGTRKDNVGTDKEEEKKLAGPLAKKELPADGCSRTVTSTNLPCDVLTRGKLALKLRNTAARAVA